LMNVPAVSGRRPPEVAAQASFGAFAATARTVPWRSAGTSEAPLSSLGSGTRKRVSATAPEQDTCASNGSFAKSAPSDTRGRIAPPATASPELETTAIADQSTALSSALSVKTKRSGGGAWQGAEAPRGAIGISGAGSGRVAAARPGERAVKFVARRPAGV